MRLGDLDKAEAVLRNIADHLKENGDDSLLWASAYTAADIIKRQPSVDAAIEVVCCKDCKHYAMWADGRAMNHCDKHDRLAYDDDFCSYGERRE